MLLRAKTHIAWPGLTFPSILWFITDSARRERTTGVLREVMGKALSRTQLIHCEHITSWTFSITFFLFVSIWVNSFLLLLGLPRKSSRISLPTPLFNQWEKLKTKTVLSCSNSKSNVNASHYLPTASSQYVLYQWLWVWRLWVFCLLE